jgi:hypothetical protein
LELNYLQVHPLFKALVPPEEKQVESFFESLRDFRPPQNILQITGTFACPVRPVRWFAHALHAAKNSKTLSVPVLPRLKKRLTAADDDDGSRPMMPPPDDESDTPVRPSSLFVAVIVVPVVSHSFMVSDRILIVCA